MTTGGVLCENVWFVELVCSYLQIWSTSAVNKLWKSVCDRQITEVEFEHLPPYAARMIRRFPRIARVRFHRLSQIDCRLLRNLAAVQSIRVVEFFHCFDLTPFMVNLLTRTSDAIVVDHYACWRLARTSSRCPQRLMLDIYAMIHCYCTSRSPTALAMFQRFSFLRNRRVLHTIKAHAHYADFFRVYDESVWTQIERVHERERVIFMLRLTNFSASCTGTFTFTLQKDETMTWKVFKCKHSCRMCIATD